MAFLFQSSVIICHAIKDTCIKQNLLGFTADLPTIKRICALATVSFVTQFYTCAMNTRTYGLHHDFSI